TSTALLVEVLRPLGWKVDFYLPKRMDEGYGLSADGVENCLKKFSTKLVLAHHQVSSPAPATVALVNPQVGVQASACSEHREGQPKGWTPTFTELCSV